MQPKVVIFATVEATASRHLGPARTGADGNVRWHVPAPEGEFAYGAFERLEVFCGVT